MAGGGVHESALSVARKNAKSAICAVLALGHLVGPLRTPGWRGAIASVSKEKAAELRNQVAAIAAASGLSEVKVRLSPHPGAILSDTGGLETLSADRTAGHSSSFDLVIVDETGLMPERSRELLAGLRSSVSAKGGRSIHISVRGDSPLFAEILDNPAVVSHLHAAPDGCDVSDRAAWALANPTLGTINRHFPANLQIHGNRIYIAPPRELHSLRSPPMTRLWRADHVRKAIWQRFPPSRHTSPVFSTLPSISSAYAGTGLRRRSSIKAKIFWNKIFDTATSASWNVT